MWGHVTWWSGCVPLPIIGPGVQIIGKWLHAVTLGKSIHPYIPLRPGANAMFFMEE